MTRKVLDASAVEKLKQLLPALQQFLSEEGTEPQHQAGAAPAAPAAPAAVDAPLPEGSTAGEPDVTAAPAAAPAAPAAPTDEGDPIAEIKAMLQQVLACLQPDAEEAPTAPAAPDAPAEPAAPDAPADKPDAEDESGEMDGKVMDAAVRRVYIDQAAKAALYDRASKIVGAFDHKTMDSKALASYCVKQLKIKCAAGQEVVALDSYLSGAETAARNAAKPAVVTDSAVTSTEMAAYLSGAK